MANSRRGLVPLLRDIRFTSVLTSPRQRARRTYELTGIGMAAEVEPDLEEWNYAAYEGRRSVEIARERPGWNVFRDGCPGGESPADIAARADRLIGRLTRLGGTIALFSHGQFGSILTARWIGLSAMQAQHFWIRTASLCELGSHPSHPELRIIAQWNSVPPSRSERERG